MTWEKSLVEIENLGREDISRGGMLCPRLPEEGDAGWSTPGCAAEVFWHPRHPNCCQVTLV